MRNRTRNLGWALLALASLLAWDLSVTTAGSLPGSEAKRLVAQETEVRGPTDEERMFTEARRALNRGEYDLAAQLFQAVREKYPRNSGYSGSTRLGRFVADSYYWEAFGRFRQGDFAEALLLLDLVSVYDEAQPPSGRIYTDVRNLRVRVQRQLAEQGDAGAAEEALRDAERVLARDTAAIRNMRREYEAQIRQAQQQWAAEQERMRRAVQEAIDRYRTQADTTDWQEALRMQVYDAELLQALQRQQDSLGHLGVTVFNPGYAPIVYTGAGGVRVLDFPGYDPILAGIDIHPECVDALAQQEALTSLLRLEVDVMPTVRDILDRDDDCSAHLRYMSLNWLGGQTDDEARDLLTKVAGDHPDTRTRQWAVTRLANFESPEVADVLVNFLRDSDDGEVQDAAIYGLYRQDSREANEALIAFAADGSKPDLPRQRAAVLVAERVAGGALWQTFNRLDSDVVKRAYLGVVGARIESGEQGIASWLLTVVVDGEQSETVRSGALQAWSRQPSLDLEQVVRTYRMLESAEMRDQFLYALYQNAESDEENADAVIDTMIELARQETDPEVRKRAIYWLGRTGSERAAAFLMEILREGSGWPAHPAN